MIATTNLVSINIVTTNGRAHIIRTPTKRTPPPNLCKETDGPAIIHTDGSGQVIIASWVRLKEDAF